MTTVGVVVAAADRALVWADTMTFRNGAPSRHVPKLTINATAAVVGAGTGWCSLMGQADQAVTQAADLEALVHGLPALLRHQAARLAERRGDPETFRSNAYVVAGYCPRFRRIMAYVFDAESYFAPAITTAWCAPHVPDLAAMNATSFADLEGVLTQQTATLEHAHGCQIGGYIIGAEVAPGEIASRVLLELGAERATVSDRQPRGAMPER